MISCFVTSEAHNSSSLKQATHRSCRPCQVDSHHPLSSARLPGHIRVAVGDVPSFRPHWDLRNAAHCGVGPCRQQMVGVQAGVGGCPMRLPTLVVTKTERQLAPRWHHVRVSRSLCYLRGSLPDRFCSNSQVHALHDTAWHVYVLTLTLIHVEDSHPHAARLALALRQPLPLLLLCVGPLIWRI
jgi:hypothetical protein